jgi:hypothetical protein
MDKENRPTTAKYTFISIDLNVKGVSKDYVEYVILS